ncbi:MAG: hypothetical protein R3B96_13450 [Pirellulaceae bacterium]
MSSAPPPNPELPSEPNWATDPTIPWSPGSASADASLAGSENPTSPRSRTRAPETRSRTGPGQPARTDQLPRTPSGTAPTGTSAADSGADADDLVERTRRQIRRLTQEIAALARAEISLIEFHEGFLSRVTQALVSQGAAIWLNDPEDGLQLAYQVQLPSQLIEADPAHLSRHQSLLLRHMERGEAGLVPPRAGAHGETGLVNPTDSVLVLRRCMSAMKSWAWWRYSNGREAAPRLNGVTSVF